MNEEQKNQVKSIAAGIRADAEMLELAMTKPDTKDKAQNSALLIYYEVIRARVDRLKVIRDVILER